MRFFLIFLLLPLQLFSQELEGVWTGTIYNDTTKKYIPYEIAITESKGKISGYSHTVFTDENSRQLFFTASFSYFIYTVFPEHWLATKRIRMPIGLPVFSFLWEQGQSGHMFILTKKY